MTIIRVIFVQIIDLSVRPLNIMLEDDYILFKSTKQKKILLRVKNMLFYGTNKIIFLKGDLKMNEEIKDLLGEEIKSQIKDLSNLETGSEKKSSAIKDLAQLYKLRIEQEKNEMELEERRIKREDENICHTQDEDFRKSQLKEQNIDRYLKLGVAILDIGLPLLFYGAWMKKGFKFEETGTFTSSTFRNLFSRFRPTKR